jgi:hypothetical protein
MKGLNRERLKLYILFLLVITSFIQVGILWYYQNQRVPTNFLWGFFNTDKNETVYDIGYFFKPYRIVVTEGYENPHWVIDEDHEFYSLLWDEARVYMSNLLSKKGINHQGEYNREYWGEVVLRKSFVFEFKTNISKELLAAFLNVNPDSDFKPGGIYKMAILPSENINRNLTIYVYNGTSVNKYVMPYEQKGLHINDFDNIISELYEEDSNGYNVVKEYISNYVYDYLSPDVLIVAKGNSFWEFESLICHVPDKIKNTRTNEELADMAKVILGEDHDEYMKNIDVYNVIVFQNLSNMYRIYRDGLLEYRYLYVIDNNDKGSESEALNKALNFIKSREELISPEIDIYLSGITRNQNYYTFTFDYKYKDRSVALDDYKINNKDGKSLNHAITIDVNSKRVLNCYWLLKDFKKGNEKMYLNVKFEYMFEDVFGNNSGLDRNDFSIRDVNVVYEIKYTTDSQSLKPVWSIETMQGKKFIVPMREKPE